MLGGEVFTGQKLYANVHLETEGDGGLQAEE